MKRGLSSLIRKAFLLAVCLAGLQLHAQKMSVESFEHVQTDTDGIMEPTMKPDNDGEKCAIIKIETTEHKPGGYPRSGL